MEVLDLREAIECANYLNRGFSNKQYKIGIVVERIPALSYIEAGTVVIFSNESGDFMTVELPNMSGVLKTTNTIVGVPSKFVKRIILE